MSDRLPYLAPCHDCDEPTHYPSTHCVGQKSAFPTNPAASVTVETLNGREIILKGPDKSGVFDLIITNTDDGDQYAWLHAEDLAKIGEWINGSR
jgi:hypothetical protein